MGFLSDCIPVGKPEQKDVRDGLDKGSDTDSIPESEYSLFEFKGKEPCKGQSKYPVGNDAERGSLCLQAEGT
jgi:hypothetical protein